MKYTILIPLILISCSQPQKQIEEKTAKPELEDITEESESKVINPIGTGKITTIADGFDTKRVNLYNSTGTSRTINCFLVNNDRVNILEDADPYYLIEKVDKPDCNGYCMKGFVISDN